ncbi:MAG: hypothetical protein Q9207_006029 [Kuettlingeria erythrocarpa]
MASSTGNFAGSHNYTFKTGRLCFRPVRLDDTADVFALKSDPRVFFWTEPQKHEPESEAWIRARLESDCYLSFCVEELPDTQLERTKQDEKTPVIGIVGGTQLPEIGYMFRPAYWGRGYATEAVKGFIEFYWDTFPDGHPTIAQAEERKFLKAVTGPVEEAPQTRASIAVLKK